MDILFFKVHVHADQPQLPDRLQGRDRIAGKPGNGLGEYHINLTGPAVCQHPLKFSPCILRTGYGFIRINTSVIPARRFLDQAAVIAHLRRQGMEHCFLAIRHPRICGHALLFRCLLYRRKIDSLYCASHKYALLSGH